jgi:hypothetical protein
VDKPADVSEMVVLVDVSEVFFVEDVFAALSLSFLDLFLSESPITICQRNIHVHAISCFEETRLKALLESDRKYETDIRENSEYGEYIELEVLHHLLYSYVYCTNYVN